MTADFIGFIQNLKANFSSHMLHNSKYQYFVCGCCPFAEQVQTSTSHTFHKSFRPEPAGLLARPSGCHFAAFGQ